MGNYTGTNGIDTIGPGAVSAGVITFPLGSTPSDANDTVIGLGGSDVLGGGGGRDFLSGGAGNDAISGDDGDDSLFGGSDNDFLIGLFGNDVMNGGSGTDHLIGGDFGNDRFDFDFITDSAVGINRDIIHGFDGNDTVDLSGIDANVAVAGNQTFQYIHTFSFFAPGQVRVSDVGPDTLIQLNTDSDLFAESEIQVSDGQTVAGNWNSLDFIL